MHHSEQTALWQNKAKCHPFAALLMCKCTFVRPASQAASRTFCWNLTQLFKYFFSLPVFGEELPGISMHLDREIKKQNKSVARMRGSPTHGHNCVSIRVFFSSKIKATFLKLWHTYGTLVMWSCTSHPLTYKARWKSVSMTGLQCSSIGNLHHLMRASKPFRHI